MTDQVTSRLWTWGTLLAPTIVLVAVLRPWMWVDSPPLTGDWVGHMSAFDFPPFHSFTTTWWGGHPLWYFYFPFPFWIGQLAGAGNLAVKAVAMLPVVVLPLAAWWLARNYGRPRGETVLWVFATAAYLVTPFSHREGGILFSALVGEFNYSWGLLFSVGCLAAARGGQTRTAGLLLAGGMLSHPIPAVICGLVLVRRWTVWLPAAGLTAWWWIPALGRVEWVNSRHQTPLSWPWVSHGAGWWMWILVAASAAGAFLWWKQRRQVGGIIMFGLLPFAYFWWQGLSVVHAPLWNGRVRPLFVLVGFWAAASAIWWLVARFTKTRAEEWATVVGLGLLLFCLFQPGSWRTASLRTWQLENDLTTLDASWEDMPAILNELETLPRSIVATEYAARLSAPRLAWAIPQTGHRSALGVYYESARSAQYWQLATTQISSLNMINIWGHAEQYPPEINAYHPEKGIDKVRALGARWLIATLETVSGFPPGLVDTVWEGTWLGLYDTGATPISRVIDPPPRVEGHKRWEWWNEHAVRWAEPVNKQVAVGERHVTFDASIGGETWVLAVSCFPGWQLTTPGRVECSPTNQLMVTPTRAGPVELEWTTGGLEETGKAVTLLAAAAACWIWTRPKRPSMRRVLDSPGYRHPA